jgi:hypothetical protein
MCKENDMSKFVEENWFKLGILLALFAVGTSVSFYLFYALPKENKAMLAKKTNLELQEKCAKRAKEYFDEKWSVAPAGMAVDYSCHFNNKLNKCFINIRTLDNAPSYMANISQLFDAYEGVQYAEFSKLVKMGEGRKYDDIPPEKCLVAGTSCKSNNEYQNLVRPYLTE